MSAEQPVLHGEPDSKASASEAASGADAAGGARLDWLMLTVARPALVQVGEHTLRTDQRVAVELAAEAVRAALATVLDRRVRYGWRGLTAPTGDPAFAVLLELGGGECAVTFDEPLARLLIDAFTSDHVRLRGVGPPTEVELGVLEYVVLACLDDLARSLPEGWSEPALKTFPRNEEFRAWREAAAAGAVTASVAAAGAKGRLQVWLPAPLAAALSAGAIADGTHALTRAVPYTQVRVRLALPTVTLSGDEVRALDVGDVVLLGLTRLEDGAAAMRLVSDTGWELASLLEVEDRPTLVRFRCAGVDPRVPETPPADAGAMGVLPTIGELTMTLAQLGALCESGWIDLPKRAGAPITLYAGSVPLGVGELVRVHDELGVRLMEGAGDVA